MLTISFDNVFDAYFGLKFTTENLAYDVEDIYEEPKMVDLDDINKGDILQHISGVVFQVVKIEEAYAGSNDTMIITGILLNVGCHTCITLTDEYLQNCFKYS